MPLVKNVREWYRILIEPRTAFTALEKKPFEKTLVEYLYLLIVCAVVAGIFSIVVMLLKAVYYDFLMGAEVRYLRLVNYAFGRGTSLLFLYAFSGTIILFFVSLLLRLFTGKIKYVRLLSTLFYSLAPILLFGWLYPIVLPLFVWSLILFIEGLRPRSGHRVKGSISQRD